MWRNSVYIPSLAVAENDISDAWPMAEVICFFKNGIISGCPVTGE
jgi:hypothetical protein